MPGLLTKRIFNLTILVVATYIETFLWKILTSSCDVTCYVIVVESLIFIHDGGLNKLKGTMNLKPAVSVTQTHKRNYFFNHHMWDIFRSQQAFDGTFIVRNGTNVGTILPVGVLFQMSFSCNGRIFSLAMQRPCNTEDLFHKK